MPLSVDDDQRNSLARFCLSVSLDERGGVFFKRHNFVLITVDKINRHFGFSQNIDPRNRVVLIERCLQLFLR